MADALNIAMIIEAKDEASGVLKEIQKQINGLASSIDKFQKNIEKTSADIAPAMEKVSKSAQTAADKVSAANDKTKSSAKEVAKANEQLAFSFDQVAVAEENIEKLNEQLSFSFSYVKKQVAETAVVQEKVAAVQEKVSTGAYGASHAYATFGDQLQKVSYEAWKLSLAQNEQTNATIRQSSAAENGITTLSGLSDAQIVGAKQAGAFTLAFAKLNDQEIAELGTKQEARRVLELYGIDVEASIARTKTNIDVVDLMTQRNIAYESTIDGLRRKTENYGNVLNQVLAGYRGVTDGAYGASNALRTFGNQLQITSEQIGFTYSQSEKLRLAFVESAQSALILEGTLPGIIATSQEISDSFRKATSETRLLIQAMNSGKLSSEEMGRAVSALNDRLDLLPVAEQKAIVATKEYQAAMATANAESRNFNDQSKLSALGSSNVALAVAAAGYESVKYGMSMQKATAQVAASANISVGAATSITDAMTNTMGKSIFSGQQMAAALAPIAGQLTNINGKALTASSAMTFMNSAVTLATASGEKLNPVAASLAKVMQIMGDGMNKSSQDATALFNASRDLGLPVERFTQALIRVTPEAAGSGMSIQQLAAFMVTLGKTSGTEMHTVRAAGQVIASLAQPSKTGAETMAQLGIATLNAHKPHRDLISILETLRSKIAVMPGVSTSYASATTLATDKQKMFALQSENQTKAVKNQEKALRENEAAMKLQESKLSQNSVLQAIFGKQANIAAQLILNQTGVLGKNTKAMSDGKAMADAATKNMNTFSGQIQILKAVGIDLATAFGQVLIPVLSFILKAFVELVSGAADLVGGMKPLADIIGVLATALAGYWLWLKLTTDGTKSAKIIDEIWGVTKKALTAFTNAQTTSLQDLTAATEKNTFLTKAQEAAQIALSAAQKVGAAIAMAFNAVMDANPIMLVIIAIGLLVVAVVLMYEKFKWFRDFVHSVWDAFKNDTQVAIDAVKKIFDDVKAFIGAWIQLIQDVLNGKWSKIWSDIKRICVTGWQLIWDWFITLPAMMLTAAVKIGSSVVNGIWNGISNLGPWLLSQAEGLAKSLADALNPLNWFGGGGGGGLSKADMSKLNSGSALGTKTNVKGRAEGGLVTRPEIALIGEAGPELIIPLSQLPGGMNAVTGTGSPSFRATGLSGAGGGTTINVNLNMQGAMYGNVNQALNDLGRHLATVLVPGSGTRLSTI